MSKVVFYTDIIEACNHETFPARSFPEGVKLLVKFKGSDCIPSYKILTYEDELILWFRGTKVSKNDVVIDVSYLEEEFLGGLCHGGYLKASRDALVYLAPYIAGHKKIVTLGHSLGGACASVVATILKLEMGIEDVRGFTLACPGIFSPDVAEKTRSFITTFVRKMDPIPRIFNVKTPTYDFVNKKVKDMQLVSAQEVPGRLIILDSDGETVQARRPLPGDFDLNMDQIIHLTAHSQRAYLADILAIFGDEVTNAPQTIVKQKPEKIFVIRKNRAGMSIGVGAAATLGALAFMGPHGIILGGIGAAALGVWYKVTKKTKIGACTPEDFADEEEAPKEEDESPKEEDESPKEDEKESDEDDYIMLMTSDEQESESSFDEEEIEKLKIEIESKDNEKEKQHKKKKVAIDPAALSKGPSKGTKLRKRTKSAMVLLHDMLGEEATANEEAEPAAAVPEAVKEAVQQHRRHRKKKSKAPKAENDSASCEEDFDNEKKKTGKRKKRAKKASKE